MNCLGDIMQKKYILISGGELFNKGAQSMSFITIDEMKKRFPNHEVILLSTLDDKRNEEEKSKYNFKIYDDIFKILFLNGLYAKINRIDKHKVKESKQILENTDMMIDISGFALSSINIRATLLYLSKLKLAKKYKIKTFLMPQSFGPFKYKGLFGKIIDLLLKKYLTYPKVIFAREIEGYNLLKEKYNLSNVRKSPDLVLLNNTIDLNNIYIKKPENKEVNIKNNSIGIIPNMQNFRFGDKDEVITLYETIIKKLLDKGEVIYLIRHSYEDIEACNIIKQKFSNENKVILLPDEFSSIEFNQLVKQFKFIIASRYHSIIHAYRNYVPCIALGWATKYHELLKLFNQDKYIFDVRKKIDFNSFIHAVDIMSKEYNKEKEIIRLVMKDIQVENIFDVIE